MVQFLIMRKRLPFLITTFLFINISLYSQSLFDIGVSSGLNFGSLEEKLYSSVNKDSAASILNWEEKPAYFIGLDFGFNYKRFHVSFNNTFDLPVKCGLMEDRDFEGDLCFNYSINENYKHFYYNGDLTLSYDAYKGSGAVFSPELSFIITQSKNSSENGYGWYGAAKNSLNGETVSWDSPYAKEIVQGKLSGIILERFNFSAFIGFNTTFILNQKFMLGLNARFSPYGFTRIIDEHRDDFEAKHSVSHSHTSFYENIDYFNDFILSLMMGYNLTQNSFLRLNMQCYWDNTKPTKTYAKGYLNQYVSYEDYIELEQDSTSDYFRCRIWVEYIFKF